MIIRNMVLKDEVNFPHMISHGFKVVVRRRSRVWRSLSPLTLPAVSAGMMNISITNSTAATNMYKLVNEEYWISAVSLTRSTTEYILSRTTKARIVLKSARISARRKLLELTVVSRL